MANTRGHRLTDIRVPSPNKALGNVMRGAGIHSRLSAVGGDVVLRYKARVAKRSGRLQQSAKCTVMFGGHNKDRLVAKVTVGGPSVVAPEPWHGRPFFYGVLHEHGSPTKREKFAGAHDLRRVRDTILHTMQRGG